MRTRLAALFFLSGVSGLVFQVVWFRRLALIFGVTSYALAIVLSAFMAGLAIGSVAGGLLADRRRNPLRTYGFTELAIAMWGVSVLPLLALVQRLYVSFAPSLVDQPATLNGVRFALSFFAMIPATACMGATLPLGLRAYNRHEGSGVSRLYAANTAGAVTGVLAAGFVFIGIAGLAASSVIAAVLNLVCGCAALMMARSESDTPAPETISAPVAPHSSRLAGRHVAVLCALFFGGVAALADEVIWTRLFSVLAFEIVYGYATMLAVLLAGVAVGSAAYGRWTRFPERAATHLIWIECAIGVVAALSLVLLKPLASDSLIAGAQDWPLVGAVVGKCPSCVSTIGGLLTAIFVTSVLSGAALPAATHLFTRIGPGWATRFGVGYASNVVGGVLGSLLAGFWLLPRLGAHVSLVAVAAINVAIAVGLALVWQRRVLAAAVAVVGVAAMLPAILDRTSLDVYRTTVAARVPTARVLWYEEGVESSVAVAQSEGERFLLINGSIHGASSGLFYHRWLGHLGVMAHPDPKDALVIGLGGGATAGAMALHPGLRIHVVELSGGVVAAADGPLSDDNYGLFRRDNVTRDVNDGRNYLLLADRRYDIIEADILEPRHAGASVLYSYEYFESARRALKPDGIMVQWLGAPTAPAYPWTLTTFRRVFPYVSLWIGGDLAVGSTTPQPALDRQRLARLFANPTLGQALKEARLGSPEAILAMKKVEQQPPLAGPILTDDRPVLEYFVTLPVVTRWAFGSAAPLRR